MSAGEIFDFARQYVSFVPVDAQARHLVDHLLLSGHGWGNMYVEAARKAFLAAHQSQEERFFGAILHELRLRVIGAALAGIR